MSTEPDQGNPNIQVEITDASELHCFRLIFNPKAKETGDERHRIEILLHARSLVDLIHKCSLALCDWQGQTTSTIVQHLTGLTEEEARARGLLAPR